jgi:hypothetical protein
MSNKTSFGETTGVLRVNSEKQKMRKLIDDIKRVTFFNETQEADFTPPYDEQESFYKVIDLLDRYENS